jgi:hypothetical protein
MKGLLEQPMNADATVPGVLSARAIRSACAERWRSTRCLVTVFAHWMLVRRR